MLLSIVVPAFNEEDVLPEFHKRLTAEIDTLPLNVEIIYVNDGSTDSTLAVIKMLIAISILVNLWGVLWINKFGWSALWG